VPRRFDQLGAVPIRELRREQAHARHVQLSSAHGLQKLGVSPPRAGCRDALVGDRFGEVQRTHAPSEHRGERLAQIQATRIYLTEMGKQIGLDCVPASDQCVQA
jgi:hypothetical protein